MLKAQPGHIFNSFIHFQKNKGTGHFPLVPCLVRYQIFPTQITVCLYAILALLSEPAGSESVVCVRLSRTPFMLYLFFSLQ